jgi:hypothetical protein
MEHAEMVAKRVRTGARLRLAAGLLLTAITPELIGVWLFVVAPEHMRAIFREPESL